jgi:hypothetical protein
MLTIGGELRRMRLPKWISPLARVELVWTTSPNETQKGRLSVLETRIIIGDFRVGFLTLLSAMTLFMIPIAALLRFHWEDTPGRMRVLFPLLVGPLCKLTSETAMGISRPPVLDEMANQEDHFAQGTEDMERITSH